MHKDVEIDYGSEGWAGWRGMRGKNWDNYNSINNNKNIYTHIKKKSLAASPQIFPQKVKCRVIISTFPAILLLDIYPRKWKTYAHTEMCIQIFTAAYIHNGQKVVKKNPNV